MRNGLSPRVYKSSVIILVVIAVMLSGFAEATLSVEPGHSIQAAIIAANPGQIIEVQNGTFYERINVTKPLVLKGVGRPVIDASGIGSAITISANGSTLMGFTATGSGIGAEDAGIRVLSDRNIIKDNTAIKNNNYGMILIHVDNNTVFLNTMIENEKGGILLIHSNHNLVWGNNVSRSGSGISIETSRDNTIDSNNLTRNEMGINISNNDISESITPHGKGVSIKYGSTSKLATYNIGMNSTSSSTGVNLIYNNNLQDNGQNAFDDGNNQWDNGKVGNHYSNYDAYEQGCTDRNRDGICDNSYSIPGGHNVDRLPKASPDAILSYKSKGSMGSELKIDQKTFTPGTDINVTYAVPRNLSGWVGVMKADQPSGIASQENALSYQNLEGSSGILKLKAPANSGAYELRLYNATRNDEIASLKFMVKVPSIAATPDSVYTSEDITVAYAGAPGYDNDWIAMYKSGSPDTSYITRQYLGGKENGTLVLDTPNPGSYNFRMFENNTYDRLATSNSVAVRTYNGTKVVASPTHVAPGGTVTVTYWGAPASGTGVIGMYGMTRPDKFPIETRSLGSDYSGRMTWRLPYAPGQYDFRMFYSAITDIEQGAYQILGQSDIVTVG
ncbi:MAG: NosD domain-containing protein [Methanotrichaceae archaeon]